MLNIPQKLRPVVTEFNRFRFFLLEGGRGGGKSHAVARFLLHLGEKRSIRVVCGREIQKNIDESVYTIMVDLINQYDLNYEIQKTKLTHRVSGTEISFRGFREQGAFNIQGMEGVDVLWIDEAQAISKTTMQHLTPTIRGQKSRIFFTMNRHVVDDPAFTYCFGDPDTLHIHIDYLDNPYCTMPLLKDAEKCKARSIEDYNHIWLGRPLEKSEDAVFAIEELMNTSVNRYQLRQAYGFRIAGFDIARFGDDKCACVIIQQMGALHWEVIHVEEWGQKDLNYTTGRILEIVNKHQIGKAIIDEDGIGSGPLDTLSKGRGLDYFTGFRNPQLSYQESKDYANPRTLNTYKLKEMVVAGHLAMTDEILMRELATLRYTFDHNQRKILVSKQQMRKDGVKSPNQADALIMAASLIGSVKTAQDRQYVSRGTNTAPEGNLFEIAGVR